jgi:hypothetical protein
MKNVHLIPTNKPSRLWTNNLRRRLELDEFPEQHPNNIAKHIYITSDEEPKHLDYYITKITDSNGERYSVGQRLDTNDSDYSNCKKIILTTDQDLIKDGVQAISDKFLEWFIKNLTCEKVEVEKLDTFKKTNEVYVDEIAGGNYYEIIKNYKITIPQEEPKKETVEEAAEKYVKSDLKKTPLYWLFHDTFKAGAKWQQEQDKKMYNEEEVRETVNWKAVYEESLSMQRTSNAGYESKINELKEKIKTMYSEKEVLELLRKAHFVEQNIEEWFEQFKKKINARKFEKRKPH